MKIDQGKEGTSAAPAFDRVHRFYDAYMRVMGIYREKLIAKLLSLDGTERVVDLGGGTGYVARYLAPYCKEVWVLDESPKMLSHAGGHRSVRIVKANALATPFPDSYFDVAVLSDVLHHVADQETLLDEAKRILRPKGRLLIYDFDADHPGARLSRWFEARLFGQLYCRNLAWVEQLLAKKGFDAVKGIVRGHRYIIIREKREAS